mgnify:CR=1 FL=1
MPTDDERIAEMRPSEWLRFANALLEANRQQMERDVKINALYEELAHVNGLKEHDRIVNIWIDKNGNKYKLKRSGFEFIIDK